MYVLEVEFMFCQVGQQIYALTIVPQEPYTPAQKSATTTLVHMSYSLNYQYPPE